MLNTGSFTAIAVGGIALFFSSMWAFLELRSALNTMWNLQPDPTKTSTYDWLVFLGRRALSFLVLVAVALVVLFSFVTSTVLLSFGEQLTGMELPCYCGVGEVQCARSKRYFD